jgi:SAM-dependent methyltransferase
MTAPASFSGSIPESYDRYLVPVLFEPYAADLVGRIEPRDGLRVLELACGTGVVTRRLRRALPGAAIVATDLSPPMLALAQATPLDGVTWRVADAQALPFPDASFDAVVFQFGLMFVPDKVRAFAEARRVLVAGGQLLINVWDGTATNPYAAEMSAALRAMFPADPPRFVEMVHGYCDDARITADARAAGWPEVALDHGAIRGHAHTAADLAAGFAHGSPIRQLIVERGGAPEAFAARLTTRFAAVAGNAPCEPAMSAIVISARR